MPVPRARRVNPVMLVGLGSACEASLRRVKTLLKQGYPELYSSSMYLILRDSGELVATNGSDTILGEAASPTLSLSRLVKSGTYRDNFVQLKTSVVEWRNLIYQLEREKIRSQKAAESRLSNELFGQATRRDLWVLTTSYDPIGSSAILPFVRAYSLAQRVLLRREQLRLNLVLFGPGVLDDAIEDYAFARTRSLFDELEDWHNLAASIDELSENVSLSNDELIVWLVSGQNEVDEILPDPDYVFRSLAEMVEIAQSDDYRHQDESPTRGVKRQSRLRRQYHMFGIKRVYFPAEEAIRTATSRACAEIIEKNWTGEPHQVTAREASNKVKGFLANIEIFRIEEKLRRANTEEEIRPRFEYDQVGNVELPLEAHLKNIAADVEKFRVFGAAAVESALDASYNQLKEILSSKVVNEIAALCDQPSEGPLAASAFVSALAGESRAAIGTGSLDSPDDLLSARDQTWSRLFEFFGLSDRRQVIRDSKRELDEMNNNRRDLETRVRARKNEVGDNPDGESRAWIETSEGQLREYLERIDALERKLDSQHREQFANEANIENSIWRRQFLVSARDVRHQQFLDPEIDKLGQIEAALQSKRDQLNQLLETRGKGRQRQLILYPLVATFVSIAGSVLLQLSAPGIWFVVSKFWWYLSAAVLLLLFARGGYRDYLLNREIGAVREDLAKLRLEKKASLKKVVDLYCQDLAHQFDEHVLSRTHELVCWLASEAKRHHDFFSQFVSGLLARCRELRSDWSKFVEMCEIAEGCLVGAETLNELYDRASSQVVAIAMNIVGTKTANPSHIEMSKVLTVSHNADRAISTLEAAVRKLSRSPFAPWEDYSVDGWFEAKPDFIEKSSSEVRRRVQRALRSPISVVGQFKTASSDRIFECGFFRTPNTGSEKLNDFSKQVFPNNVTPQKIHHVQKHELLCLRQVLQLRADETEEFHRSHELTGFDETFDSYAVDPRVKIDELLEIEQQGLEDEFLGEIKDNDLEP